QDRRGGPLRRRRRVQPRRYDARGPGQARAGVRHEERPGVGDRRELVAALRRRVGDAGDVDGPGEGAGNPSEARVPRLRRGRLRAAAPARPLARGDDVRGRRPWRRGAVRSMSIVRAFTEAFNRADVDGLLDRFTTDATYTDNFYGPHRGPVALREMFARMFKE